jgi:hypothetical protein
VAGVRFLKPLARGAISALRSLRGPCSMNCEVVTCNAHIGRFSWSLRANDPVALVKKTGSPDAARPQEPLGTRDLDWL